MRFSLYVIYAIYTKQMINACFSISSFTRAFEQLNEDHIRSDLWSLNVILNHFHRLNNLNNIMIGLFWTLVELRRKLSDSQITCKINIRLENQWNTKGINSLKKVQIDIFFDTFSYIFQKSPLDQNPITGS